MNEPTTELRYVLVIPAYNEEEAIASTLRRALVARDKVLAQTPVTEMTVVVVNDGSRDRTQQIVDQPEFDEVVKVRFLQNRGYGAAIKAGFRTVPGELVGFMDADGTCDPEFSIQLIRRLLEDRADVVLASRLNADSKMPLVRRIGNRIFSALLNALAGASVVDTASGFRVIRRESLKLLSPLPNGLHYTPAMSCICALDPRLRIAEVPMPYQERIGRSKLSVILDGVRFLYTILFSFCCYSPLKSAMVGASVLAVLCVLLAVGMQLVGGSHVLQASLATSLLVLGVLVVWTGAVVHQLNYLLIGPRRHLRRSEGMLQRLLHYKGLMAVGAFTTMASSLSFIALALVHPAFSGTLATVTAAGLTVLMTAGMAASTLGLVTRVIWAVSEKQKSLVSSDYESLGAMEIRRPKKMALSSQL